MTALNQPFFSMLVTETDQADVDTVSEIPLDVRSASTYSFQAEVTENPVEDGSVVSDHVVIKPDRITVEGFVSDAPLRSNTTGTAPNTKGNKQVAAASSKPQSAYDLIKQVFQAKTPVTVICEYDLFDDMIIESWEAPRSSDRGQAFYFTLTLKKIVTVETLTEALPPEVVARLKRRRKKTARARDANAKLKKLQAQQQKLVDAGRITKETAAAVVQTHALALGSSHTAAKPNNRLTTTQAST